MSQDFGLVESELATIAAELAMHLGPRGPLNLQWAQAGITVNMAASRWGSGRLINGTMTVEVSPRDPEPRQRFTVAHEVGHLLLAKASRSLTGPLLEALCDHFAQALLVPASALAPAIGDIQLFDVERFLTVSDSFGVSWGALTMALRPVLAPTNLAVLLARRWDAEDPRWEFSTTAKRRARSANPINAKVWVVDRFAGPEALMARRGCSLVDLGLTELDRLLRMGPRRLVAGEDDACLNHEPQWRSLTRPTSWTARRFNGYPPSAVVVIEVHDTSRPGSVRQVDQYGRTQPRKNEQLTLLS